MSQEPPARRDRLRELLDAVVDVSNTDVGDMARSSHASEFHFSREVRRLTGESPAALRRRVMLERAAWRLRGGEAVSAVAADEGWSSPEVFSRAFSPTIGGRDFPAREATSPRTASPAGLAEHHADIGRRWTTMVSAISADGRMSDTIIDALCDPPESFQLYGIVAHVLTYSAQRRGLARTMLSRFGVATTQGDPLAWMRGS